MNTRLIFRAFAYLAFVLLIVALGTVFSQMKQFEQRGSFDEDVVVNIPRGASLTHTADILERAGAIGDVGPFINIIRLSDSSGGLQAGEFNIPAGSSMAEIFRILNSGQVIQHSLTIPEGLTTSAVQLIVARAENLEGELSFLAPEGALLPETYYYEKGDDRNGFVRRMQRDMDQLLEELWLARADGLPFSSPWDAVILASVVERETGVENERSRIAAVFLNRLKAGMRLQSDPTVIYGIAGGQPLGRGLLQSDLDADTPYNTYQIEGLPPGPIANPGRAALEAVFHPMATDDLYFVADGNGGHVFAETLAEHNRNVARWRQIERDARN
jgi:peptidoglycan lytic transglycosylase G